MPSRPLTNVTPPRVPIIDLRTGYVTREWYMWFISLFNLTGGGSNSASLSDLQLGPDVSASLAQYDQSIASVRQEAETQPRAELGTMAAVQQDNARFIGYSPVPSPAVVLGTGFTAWLPTDQTLGIGLNGSVMRTGQAQMYYALNDTGGTASIGLAVMRTGTVPASNQLQFDVADADGSVDAAEMLGIVSSTTADAEFGYVTTFGLVSGWDTTGATKTVPQTWADGELLYFDPDYPGELTNVEPSAPDLRVQAGFVVNAAADGSIFVRMNNGAYLNALNDVLLSGLANNDSLFYDFAQSRWENRDPEDARDALGLGTGVPTNGQVLIGNGTDFSTALMTEGDGITLTTGAGTLTVAANLVGAGNILIAPGTGSSLDISVTPALGTIATQNLGATGVFTAGSGETITVTSGIITSIV